MQTEILLQQMQLFLGIFPERIRKIHIGKQFERTIFRGVESNVSAWENNFIRINQFSMSKSFFIRKADKRKKYISQAGTILPRQCYAGMNCFWHNFVFQYLRSKTTFGFRSQKCIEDRRPSSTRVLLRHHHLWLWHELSITKWQHQKYLLQKVMQQQLSH